MSNSNPTPEESERMVNDAVKHAMSNAPELDAKPLDDVERLFKDFAAKVIEAKKIAQPMVAEGIQSNIIHSPKGRNAVLMNMHNALIEVFRGYNREEAIFLLAWSQANWILQDEV